MRASVHACRYVYVWLIRGFSYLFLLSSRDMVDEFLLSWLMIRKAVIDFVVHQNGWPGKLRLLKVAVIKSVWRSVSYI